MTHNSPEPRDGGSGCVLAWVSFASKTKAMFPVCVRPEGTGPTSHSPPSHSLQGLSQSSHIRCQSFLPLHPMLLNFSSHGIKALGLCTWFFLLGKPVHFCPFSMADSFKSSQTKVTTCHNSTVHIVVYGMTPPPLLLLLTPTFRLRRSEC